MGEFENAHAFANKSLAHHVNPCQVSDDKASPGLKTILSGPDKSGSAVGQAEIDTHGLWIVALRGVWNLPQS